MASKTADKKKNTKKTVKPLKKKTVKKAPAKTARGKSGSLTKRKKVRRYVTPLVEKFAKAHAFQLPDDWGKMTKKGGHPPVINDKKLRVLELAFAYDATVEEACLLAGISTTAYYDFIKKVPKFTETVNLLRNAPIIVARQKVVRSVETSTNDAFAYLRSKRKKEFSTRSEVGHDGKIDAEHTVDPEQLEAVKGVFGLFASKANKSEEDYVDDDEETTDT